MYVIGDFRASGEPPRRENEPIRSSKGYPERRDPQADNPARDFIFRFGQDRDL